MCYQMSEQTSGLGLASGGRLRSKVWSKQSYLAFSVARTCSLVDVFIYIRVGSDWLSLDTLPADFIDYL
jgi:hypothetical protein